MSQIANVVLPDGNTTPVNHTFIPNSVVGNKASWVNQAPALPIGFETLSVQLQDPTAKVSVYRVTVEMKFPVLKTTTDVGGNSTTTVDYYTDFSAEFKLPQRGSLQSRKDARAMVKALFNDAQFIAVLETLQHTY